MKEILLTQGFFAIVDDADFESANKYKWGARINRETGTVYAQRQIRNGLSKETILLHRFISAAQGNFEVDHKNGNGLDNRRENLRVCTKVNNIRNQRKQKNNSTGFKGVSWDKPMKKFRAQITVSYKRIHLGYFDSAEDASRAYDAAARKYFGEFARTNF